MSSSILSGERRWASARRGGMTVLGKVAVPKPINLPSQRLENHGLDPNVEIVPKGTHGWGSKSSSSSSNAWGSPNTDGGTGSPSYLSGRPSSGGDGTRPSTAGSDRARDPVPNAWGSNSRPSSSSGVLTPNQTAQTALRPRSADTRPGSSQLSRFAEPSSDNSGAWGGSGTSEKLSGTSSKNDVFSLTTGDFPSLGSEKDYSRKNVDSQDHGSNGRPGSSSSGVTSVKGHTGDSGDDFSVNANTKPGGSWRKESSMHVEDGNRSNVEKWHSDRQPYPNSNIHHPQHFDAWHGPPVNNHPGGGWFRGPPGGPPFGSPVPPGGFPMEPFPYFHPQMPPPLANAPPGHPHNTAPGGSHPKNGDMYRTHMHDPYVRPSMPLRPGFYPGPGPLPYDYYGPPPMGFCNSNDRDVPFMGMPMRPGIYNSYPGHNAADPDNQIERTSGYGPTGNSMGSEKGEAVHPQDARGPYKVLLKQHESWEGRDREHKWDENAETNSSHSLKREPPKKSSWDNGWKTDDEMDARKMKHGEGTSSEAVDDRAVPMKVKSPEIVASRNLSDDGSVKKFGHAASNVPEVVASKDSSLIQKIEGLNAKARASDVRQDVKPVSTREGQKNRLQVGNMIGNEADSASFSHEKAHTSGIISSGPREDHFGPREKRFEPTVVGVASTTRKSSHGKVDHHGKMRFNNQEADGWHKKTNVLETNAPASIVHSEVSHISHGKDDRDSMPHDSDVNESQRAKMMELTKRIKQREKEEERTRDQRAKALAKLEELNRRTQSVETVADKSDTVPSTAAPSGTEIKVGPSLSLSSNTNTFHEKEKVETVACSAVHKKLEDPSISAPPIPALATNATICFGSIGDEIVTNLATNLSINPGAPSESSAHHKKKSKSGKNRQKAEEAPSKEPDESSGESARPKTSEAVSVQSMTNMTDSNQSSDLHPPLVNEGYLRSNNQGKSQHPRRMTRGQQGTKSDKSHGTDAVVWAPVRSQNKIEVSDESAQNVSSVTASQNNPKSKRAEMERYVPKPAAKELSNQGGNNQANVPNKKIPSYEATDRHETGTVGIESSEISTAASVKLGPTAEPKSGDVRRNRPGKVHGSWRQRGMAESSTNPTPYPNSYPSTNPQKPVEDHQDPNEWNDGWNMPEPPEPAVNVSVPKDQGVVARGKRHQHKGYKGTGHNHNPDEKRNVVTDPSKTSMQPAASEVNRSDSPNHAVGERSAAHWQPKTQSLPATGGGRAYKRESSSRGQQFLYEKTNLEESSDVERHHGPRGERQKVGHRGRPVSPVEVGSQPNVNVHPDRPISSGSRRNGNGNSRHNVHFEYQPVGPQNSRSNFEPPKERRHNAGSRYRERGQGQPRRGGGNFSGRQSGGVQVDGGYDE